MVRSESHRSYAADFLCYNILMEQLAQLFFNPLNFNSIPELIRELLRVAVTIATPVVVIFILYAGFLFVSARGNEQQITKAKHMLIWTIIGAILIVGAWAFAVAIVDFFKTLT